MPMRNPPHRGQALARNPIDAADGGLHALMVSPHHPPEQAANAILPAMLSAELATLGIGTRHLTHPPVASETAPAPNGVVYVGRRAKGAFGRTRLGAALAASRIALRAWSLVGRSDVAHLHSNGLIVEVAQRVAARRGTPYVITLYGTDVWHYDETRHRRFGRVVRGAACRVFYSRGLLEFARTRRLAPDPSLVIYAPVASMFRAPHRDERRRLRAELGHEGTVLLVVKRLHPVAGHEDLLRALPVVLRARPDASLVVIGDGPLRSELETLAETCGVASRVRFLGSVANAALWRHYAAADLFVLPSRLESWGTVMLEALASGTRVVATDTVGGREVRDSFPEDVTLVAREQPLALGDAICRAVAAAGQSSETTRLRLHADFGLRRCAERYVDVYRRAVGV